MKFRLIADIEYEATDGEDAARKLVVHFSKIAHFFAGNDVADNPPWFTGEMTMKPGTNE